MKQRNDFEQGILKKVAIALWLIIVLIVVSSLLIQNFVEGGIREAIFVATTMITQIYLFNPEYGALTFVLAFLGKILVIYIIYILILLFSEGLFRESIKEGKLMKTIKNMKDHYIICGGGRVGSRVADDLRAEKKDFVIIDKDAESVAMYKEKKMPAILGDSLDSGFLKEAGIERAKTIISCLNSDGDNILQIIVAKKMNKNINIVSRASHEKFITNLKHAGAQKIIIPEHIGGREIAQAALKIDSKSKK